MNIKSVRQALDYVRSRGIVLETGRGPVPNLAEVIAGHPIRGSWWSHPKGKLIFCLTRAVRDSPDILVCRLVKGKITFVHRRLWAALVKLSPSLDPSKLAALREVHTASGAHRLVTIDFPKWVPEKDQLKSEGLSKTTAIKSIGRWINEM